MQATYEDVNLILRLYDLRREPRMREARKWITARFNAETMEEFNQLCPPGSEENASFRMVTTYYEMVSSFVTSGVLNEDLLFQSGGELLLVWERLRPLLAEMRAANKNPAQYRNLEIVGNHAVAHWKRLGPEAYEAFAARIRGMAPKK
jgi:hypothetical protein